MIFFSTKDLDENEKFTTKTNKKEDTFSKITTTKKLSIYHIKLVESK